MKNIRKYLAPEVLKKVDDIIIIEKYRNDKDFGLNEILEFGVDAYAEKKGYNFNPSKETLESFKKYKANYIKAKHNE